LDYITIKRTFITICRFEQEIAGHPIAKPPPIISANTFRQASQAIKEANIHQPPIRHVQPLPRPPVPPQIRPQSHYFPPRNIPGQPMMTPRQISGPMMSQPPMVSQPPMIQQRISSQPVVPVGLPQQPHMAPVMPPAPIMPVAATAGPVAMPTYPMAVAGPSIPPQIGVPPSITPAEQKEWESAYQHNEGEGEKKKTKEKKFLRVAGSQVWEDSSLSTWDPSK